MVSERIQRQIDQFLDEAEQAVVDGDWALVRDRAEKVLRLDPENHDAPGYLAAAGRDQREISSPQASGSAQTTPAPHPPSGAIAPPSFVGGRYQTVRFLGEGGKKRVYLAHDTLLDRDVAFALIKTEGLDDDGRLRITREAQAMGKLGTHPHVVAVFDIGVEPGPAVPSPSPSPIK